MNINFKVIGLTRLGIKPESAAPEADAFITPTSELLFHYFSKTYVDDINDCSNLRS